MLKKILIGLGILVALLAAAFFYMTTQTKKASPEVTVNQQVGAANVKVFYCAPSKKDREVFGKLVPFGTVWRTGANEPTTFETDKDLTVGGQTLAAGKYSIWTIPNEANWSVIFNKEVPDWGVSWGGVAARNEKQDALKVTAAVQTLASVQEQLAITVDSVLAISWDKTKVIVPVGSK